MASSSRKPIDCSHNRVWVVMHNTNLELFMQRIAASSGLASNSQCLEQGKRISTSMKGVLVDKAVVTIPI